MKYTDELYNIESTMSALDLEKQFTEAGDTEHSIFTQVLWRDAVLNQDTVSGYWVWTHHQILSWDPDADERDREAQYRQKAMAIYADGSGDSIEINEDAEVSLGEGGAFVAAWVWVMEGAL